MSYAVNPSLPVKTLAEFIAYAKANPGKINMGSAGIGTPPHPFGELFKMMARVDMVHVPYNGRRRPSTDSCGQVQVMFADRRSIAAYIKSGKFRALAVTTAKPHRLVLPGVPTVGETVPGYEASGWQGLCAPGKTPAEIVDKLNREINAGLADPD